MPAPRGALLPRSSAELGWENVKTISLVSGNDATSRKHSVGCFFRQVNQHSQAGKEGRATEVQRAGGEAISQGDMFKVDGNKFNVRRNFNPLSI